MWLLLYISNHSPFSLFSTWRLKVAQQPSIAAGHTKGYSLLLGGFICRIHPEEIHPEQALLHTWPLATVTQGTNRSGQGKMCPGTLYSQASTKPLSLFLSLVMTKNMCLGYKFTFSKKKKRLIPKDQKELYEFSKFTCLFTEPSCVHKWRNFWGGLNFLL